MVPNLRPVTGAARLLEAGVVLLDPARAVFEAMLEGWAHQQVSRLLAASTVQVRLQLVRRFAVFTGEYPWSWSAADVEDFTASLRSRPKPVAHSTVRSYHLILAGFLDFLTDPAYRWAAECEQRFGTHPVQICHEWNTAIHRVEFEARPGNRPLSLEEVQRLFDHADAQVDRIRALGRKGSLAAFRDAALLKVVYGWGLRRREAVMLDLVDWYRNAHAPQFGAHGSVSVRWGKAMAGSPPRRRGVLTVFDWAAEAVEQYLSGIRPRFGPMTGADAHPGMWVTERGSRVSVGYLDARFAALREGAGLPAELNVHCLRHSYVTHLVEAGFDERFVQEQVGHSAASTTALYTAVSGDFKNRMLAAALSVIDEPTSAAGLAGG
jgi:integrase/recombinase XerC